MRSANNILQLFTAILCFIPLLSSAQTTVIRAGKLIDPATGTTLENQIIIIKGTKIEAVGDNLSIPQDAQLVDLSESCILPGLFDVHTHLCSTPKYGKGLDAFQDELALYTLINTTAYRAIDGVVNARAMLEAGFTTVRDVGNAGNFADAALLRAIENGLVPGPTMFISGRVIAPFGGLVHVNAEHPDLGRADYFYADTKDEIRKAIRQNIHYGASWIKIVVDAQRYIYSVDDIRFIIAEAANAGLKVAAHCLTEKGALNAIEAGVASVEHGSGMSDETLKLAKQRDVVLVGTNFSLEVLEAWGIPEFYTPITDRLKRAFKVGVKMAFGSDTVSEIPNHTRGTAALSLIDTWVQATIPAKDILQAFTINAAILLGIEKERGSVQPGYFADIIATPDNPLENIQSLKKVSFVMKEGKVYKLKNQVAGLTAK